jgi:hypothetical protein
MSRYIRMRGKVLVVMWSWLHHSRVVMALSSVVMVVSLWYRCIVVLPLHRCGVVSIRSCLVWCCPAVIVVWSCHRQLWSWSVVIDRHCLSLRRGDVAVPAIACLLVLECYLGGQWKRWNKGTHHNDDDNDYCHRALSFVVVVTRRFLPLVCAIWLPHTSPYHILSYNCGLGLEGLVHNTT